MKCNWMLLTVKNRDSDGNRSAKSDNTNGNGMGGISLLTTDTWLKDVRAQKLPTHRTKLELAIAPARPHLDLTIAM